MRIVDFEAHFYTSSFIQYLKKRSSYPKLTPISGSDNYNIEFSDDVKLYHGKPLLDRLCDIGKGRIQIMDAAGISVQVLSVTTPSSDALYDDPKTAVSLTRDLNDELHQAILQHPDRLKGFSAISPHDVTEGVRELERCITQLKLTGWLTHSNFGSGLYLDNRKYWPLLEAAENLGCPIYLHPTVPLIREYGEYGFTCAGPAMGFQYDTALCLMRMILNGVFDEFPKLKIILGHLGETMPFLMERLDFSYTNPELSHEPEFIKLRKKIDKIPSEILKENVWVSTSGRFYSPVLKFVLEAMGEDRVLFASDYPMESAQKSVQFIHDSELALSTKEKIFYKNAQNQSWS